MTVVARQEEDGDTGWRSAFHNTLPPRNWDRIDVKAVKKTRGLNVGEEEAHAVLRI